MFVPSGQVEDRVHLAADAGVVNGDNGPGARGDQALKLALVQVQRVRPDVDEHGLGAAQDEGVGGGHEGERRHDHLVAGLDVEQQGRHLQRVRAGSGEQGASQSQFVLEQPGCTSW